MILLGQYSAMGQCTFDFSASEASVCQNDKVSFSIDNLPASYKSISWNLGVKNAFGEIEPSALYTQKGAFDISLTIDDGTKTCTVKKSKYINVHPTPEIGQVIPSSSEACATGASVSFENTSSDAATWEWSIEGKVYSGTNTVKHWFLFEGHPIVQLTVKNKVGCSSSKIFDSLVHVLSKPEVHFDSLGLRACEVPGIIKPTPSYDLKGATVSKYIWRFDGATIPSDVGKQPRSKTYNLPGRYGAKLSLRTKGGCSFHYEFNDIIRVADIPALKLKAIPMTEGGCKTLRFRIKAEGATDPNSLRWSVPAGTYESADFSQDFMTDILFKNAGKYQVSCKVEKFNCLNEYVIIIDAKDGKVRAKFNAPECFCGVPGILKLKNQSSSDETLTYRWTVFKGDKEVYSSTDKDLAYKVTENGYIAVSLRAYKPDGCYDEQWSYIQTGPINLQSFMVPQSGCMGGYLDLNIESICGIRGNDIRTYFIDSKKKVVHVGKGFSPSIDVDAPGEYSVAVAINNAEGCGDSIYLTNHLTIIDCLKGLPTAVMDQEDFCNGLIYINFLPDSTLAYKFDVEAYLTYSDDSTIRVGGKYDILNKRLVFAPKIPGVYDLVVIVSLRGSTEERVLRYPEHVIMTKMEVIAQIGEESGCFPNKIVELAVASLSNELYGLSEDTTVTYSWSAFPRNKTIVWSPLQPQTNITFQENVQAQVQLSVFNSLGCRAVWQSDEELFQAFGASFKRTDSVCFGDSIELTNRSVGPIVSYQWSSTEPTDLFDPSNTVVSPGFTVSKEGKRALRLMVWDEYGCVDSFISSLNLVDLNIDFEVADTTAKCSPAIYTFSGSGKNVQKYIWNFGDGDHINTKQSTVNKIYDLTRVNPYRNLFTVSLTGIHASGCNKTVVKEDLIRVLGPWPKFEIGPLTGCSPLLTRFTDKSKNIGQLYFDYQDGSPIDSGVITEHLYSISDTSISYREFQPIVVATDGKGCKVSLRLADTIKVYSEPIARFSSSNRVGCEPFKPVLKSYSSHGTNYQWEVSSDSISKVSSIDQASPTLIAGTYGAFLKVSNEGGCVDSIYKPNYIKVLPKPNALFRPEDSISCIGMRFGFFDRSKSDVEITKWNWNMSYPGYPELEDSSANQNYKPIITSGETMIVRLIIGDKNGCSDTFIRSNFVSVYEVLPAEASQINWITHTTDKEVSLNWNPVNPAYFRRFDLYRIDTEVDEHIGSWNKSLGETTYSNQFLDTSTSCYQIRMIDRCYSVHPSDTHCTVNLKIDKDVTRQVNLSWTPYIGWDQVLSYQVLRTTNGKQFRHLATVPGNMLSYTDLNFCDSAYEYQVKAIGAKVVSNSNEDQFTPIYTYQDVPLEVTRATIDKNKQVLVNWEPSKQVGKVQYEISKNPEDGGLNRWWETVSDTFVIDSNAKVHDHFYTYRVRVRDQCGHLAGASNVGRSIVLNVDQSKDDVVLNWNSYQKWAEGVSHYTIQIKTPGQDKFETIGEVLDTFFSDNDAFLKYEEGYSYRVLAIENVLLPDTSFSNERKVIPLPSVFAANAFTPNGDGRNDEFKIIGWALVRDTVELESFHMTLFNRWGIQMFETDNINQGWDGIFRGRNAPLDQYIWLARVTGLNGEVYFLRGGVLLMR